MNEPPIDENYARWHWERVVAGLELTSSVTGHVSLCSWLESEFEL